jgi:FkbM family methyltransferase
MTMSYGDADAAVGRLIAAQGYRFPIVFDVGGSNGSWVNIMSKAWPDSRFELFEPLAEIHPKYIEVLVHLKAIHQESYMHPVAIGEKDGQITLNVFDDPSASTTLPMHHSMKTNAHTVPMRTIDSIVRSGMCKQPDMIKLDIQGGEMAALKGAAQTLPKVKFLMIETWLQRGYGKDTPLLSELIRFLSPLGFEPYEFSDVFRNEGGEAIAIDCWFINKAFAKSAWMY